MSVRTRAWADPLAIGLVGALVMFGIGLRHERTYARAPRALSLSKELQVPHAGGPLTVDGEVMEADWTRAPARTGAFVAPGGFPARPVSEARVLWDDENLYFTLYAADEDIRVAKVAPDGPVWTADAFRLELTNADGVKHVLMVGPSGTLTDSVAAPGRPADYRWQSDAKVAVDVDGTPDDPSDHDEEWVVEMAVPFRSLGLVARAGLRIGLSLRRCDLQEGRRACGSWGEDPESGVLVLE